MSHFVTVRHVKRSQSLTSLISCTLQQYMLFVRFYSATLSVSQRKKNTSSKGANNLELLIKNHHKLTHIPVCRLCFLTLLAAGFSWGGDQPVSLCLHTQLHTAVLSLSFSEQNLTRP